MNKANPNRLGYVGKCSGRDSDSWFTPAIYIEAARMVLGRLDLDPFSSDAANLTVGAGQHYTERDDAFKCSWLAHTVWMNPPFGRPFRRAVEKFVEEYRRGTFHAGIVLCNNCTETRAFQLLLNVSRAVCFTDHRISFANVDGKSISGNTRGQAFLYVSRNNVS